MIYSIVIIIIFVILVGLVDSNGVTFSRTVESIAADSNIYLIFDSGCKSTDTYGSNDCAFSWGSYVSGNVTGKLGHDLDEGSKIIVDLKVNRFISWKFTCAACGSNCTTTIPVIDKEVNFAAPPCPISAFQMTQLFNTTLPSENPSPVKVTATGDIIITDSFGKNIIDLNVDITLQ